MGENKLRISYFPIRGRAESIRMLLFDNDIPFDDNHIQFQEWKDAKQKLGLDFGQIPLLEDGDVKVVQTQAILRYLARKLNLYGQSTVENTRCDIAQEACMDALGSLLKVIYDAEFETKKQNFIDVSLNYTLNDMEKFFKKNGNDQFWVGNAVTYVDYLIWTYLDVVRLLNVDSLQKQHPILYQWHQSFCQRPNIAKWLKSEQRCKQWFPSFAKFTGSD